MAQEDQTESRSPAMTTQSYLPEQISSNHKSLNIELMH